MTETTLALCQKPVLGILMWLASMCVSNQALTEAYVDLSSPGVILNQKIHIPMDERYFLSLSFRSQVPSESSAKATSFASHVCSPGSKGLIPTATAGEADDGPGMVLELTVATPDGKLVAKEVMSPQCPRGAAPSNTIGFGHVGLARGDYVLIIVNRLPVTPVGSGRIQAVFHGQGAGFP